MNKQTYRLSELEPGQHGIIVSLTGSGEIHRRLLDMGVIKGALITLEKIAPLGDPIDIYIKGFHLSLRKKEADSVIVSICAPEENTCKCRRRGLGLKHKWGRLLRHRPAND
ncbi:MAG: ferrous iron transport protein A [Candidatus Margulisiibacteriota bacterium]